MEKSEEQKTDAACSETAAETQDVSQDDSDFDVSEEEIELDEPSDTEDYKPPLKKREEADEEDLDDDDDDEISSGEEEEGVHVQEVAMGKVKHVKLTFDDVEEKRKEYIHQLETQSDSEDDEQQENKENVENNLQENDTTANQQADKAKFDDYRQLLDEDMDQYNSDDDDNFNPVYCGETLSDVEYDEDDERNTESEPEVEEQECHEKHKRTGEPLVCIRMMEQLDLPPDCGLAATAAAGQDGASQSAMECA